VDDAINSLAQAGKVAQRVAMDDVQAAFLLGVADEVESIQARRLRWLELRTRQRMVCWGAERRT
jgi:hypothetical protein